MRSDKSITPTKAIKNTLSLEEFKEFTRPEVIIPYYNAIFSSRTVSAGIEGTIHLLSLTVKFHPHLTVKEFNFIAELLCCALLGFLNRLDAWEDYLTVWDLLRDNTRFVSTYDGRNKALSKIRFDGFLIKLTKGFAFVHYLFQLRKTKELVQRKLEKAYSGKKIGNLVHVQEHELSIYERRKRFEKRFVRATEYYNDLKQKRSKTKSESEGKPRAGFAPRKNSDPIQDSASMEAVEKLSAIIPTLREITSRYFLQRE